MKNSDTDLSSLKDCLWFQVLVMSRVLDVRLDPADVLTTPESPFLQALYTNVPSHLSKP